MITESHRTKLDLPAGAFEESGTGWFRTLMRSIGAKLVARSDIKLGDRVILHWPNDPANDPGWEGVQAEVVGKYPDFSSIDGPHLHGWGDDLQVRLDGDRPDGISNNPFFWPLDFLELVKE